MRVTTLRIGTGEALDIGGVLVEPIERRGECVRLAIDAAPGVEVRRGELEGKGKGRRKGIDAAHHGGGKGV